MTNEDYNFLCEHFALTATPKMDEMLKKLGFDNVGELVKHIENYRATKAEYAFLSGLIMGWASALEDPTQVKRVIEDMLEMSKKLSEKGGLAIQESKPHKGQCCWVLDKKDNRYRCAIKGCNKEMEHQPDE